MASRLFEPVRLGPVTLRNRTLRAAAFEGMAPGHLVSEELLAYHRAVAEGGVGMTTVAYAAVDRSGLAFPHQLWLRPEAVPGLRRLTDAVHGAGAKASIQLGHCGNMAKSEVAGGRALAPSARFNLYGPVWPRAMDAADIERMVRSFGQAVALARDAGFDAVEIHAGHGYLISQFLSPLTNRRRDGYGGPLENRMRFMREVMAEVRRAAGADLAVLAKTNLRDGFPGGNTLEDGVAVAKALEEAGADALVLTGGFVSRAPMYIMRGAMPMNVMAHGMPPLLGLFARAFGRWLVPPVPYEDHYFLEDAIQVRRSLKLPLVYVGGVASQDAADVVLGRGFDAVALARALIREPDFVRRLEREQQEQKGAPSQPRCDHCNLCAARIYTTSMACHHWPGIQAP
jgi:2,4-dienoyl-CoA reductase-like NADH-dependent reductase (Old Yellow Enzyme family)